MLKAVKQDIEEGLEITQILTHEQFEANVYKVKGEWYVYTNKIWNRAKSVDSLWK